MSKRRTNNNIDGARGERYAASPERRAYMLRLAKRLTDTAEFAAKNPARNEGPVNHRYSLTAEQSRYVAPEVLA